MNKEHSRKTTPLDDPKLERLANLLGEFLAKAWLKRNGTTAKPPVTIDGNCPVKRNNGAH